MVLVVLALEGKQQKCGAFSDSFLYQWYYLTFSTF